MISMQIQAYSHSVIGGREMNQDSFLCLPERGLFAVADGVGGGLQGDVASRMAVEALSSVHVTSENIRMIVESAQEAILAEALRTLGDALMGTTLTAVVLRGDQATLCQVGDSHCYLIAEGCLRQMNEDHEVYNETVGGTVLCSYLGLPPDVSPLKIQRETFTVAPGNRLLLCSDGLYRQLTDIEISSLIRENAAAPQVLVEKLCEEAVAHADYSDNVTVVYVEFD